MINLTENTHTTKAIDIFENMFLFNFKPLIHKNIYIFNIFLRKMCIFNSLLQSIIYFGVF